LKFLSLAVPIWPSLPILEAPTPPQLNSPILGRHVKYSVPKQSLFTTKYSMVNIVYSVTASISSRRYITAEALCKLSFIQTSESLCTEVVFEHNSVNVWAFGYGQGFALRSKHELYGSTTVRFTWTEAATTSVRSTRYMHVSDRLSEMILFVEAHSW
jgi:hypothetical protein